MSHNYYVDTCVWLNLFKKEVNKTSGIQYWKIAKDFFRKIEERQEKIIVSTIVLKELYFRLKEKFQMINFFFKEAKYIDIVKTTTDDYKLARKWEIEYEGLSFYDYLHIAITKRMSACLVTRDAELINFAKIFVIVLKPEGVFPN